jgi:hypothetical protein
MRNKFLDVLALSAMHDTSIRSYYSYQLISELASAQKKGFLDTLSLTVGVFAAIAAIVGVIQLPQFGLLIGYGTVASVLVLVIIWIMLRYRLGSSEILGYGTYLFIITDELLKYSAQIKLLATCDDKEEDFAKLFLTQTIRALSTSRKDFTKIANELKKKAKYEELLKDNGWSEKEATKLLADVDKILEQAR